MLKILNIDPNHYNQEAHKLLAGLGQVDCIPVSEQPLIDIIGQYDVLIMRFAQVLDKPTLDAATKLKVVACNVTGTDHIDTDYAREKNIAILSLKGEVNFLDTIHATAELTWGLLLGLVRKIPKAHEQASEGRWNRDEFLNHELYGKHLGIVGYGRIGKKTAAFGRAFGMNISAYDSNDQQYDDTVNACDNLITLVSTVDILLIHLPLNKTTHQSINASVLKQAKKGIYIVNTARGDIVNEQDIINGLKNETISGYGADVVSGEHEPLTLANNPLIAYAKKTDKLVLTPHIGGVTQESWAKTEVFMARKVVDFFAN